MQMDRLDDLAEAELHDACAGLGNWHSVPEERAQYLVNREECLSCLGDILLALKDEAQAGSHLCHLKLGEWKVFQSHLVPLFTTHREDAEISAAVIKLLTRLTTHVNSNSKDILKHLEYLQSYKEAFASKDPFIVLMGKIVDTMEDEGDEGNDSEDVAGSRRGGENKRATFEVMVTLLRNLVSVPDPRPGDAGYTPLRRHLQSAYVRHFHDEGLLDALGLFAEQVEADKKMSEAWIFLDVVYHICTTVDPEAAGRACSKGGRDKKALAKLLERDRDTQRLKAPTSTRHGRFGTTLQTRSVMGVTSITSSLAGMSRADAKGRKVRGRDFKDRATVEGKKQNMFHDPLFVDLLEGASAEHHILNPHVRIGDSDAELSDVVLAGIGKFYEEFTQTSFSSLVSFMRDSLTSRPGTAAPDLKARPYDQPRLLNFVAWVLEFHRHRAAGAALDAKEAKEARPGLDIASIQGAIDLDMLKFVAVLVRRYGKDSQINASHLVVALRVLSQQLKTIGDIIESPDAETKDVGEVLTQNVVKDDVMSQLAWIMKGYKPSSHDPRVLSYTVECYHLLSRLMQKVGKGLEFQVERQRGGSIQRSTTTADQELERLASAEVVESLFHLLEKYRLHTPQMNSMLVKLLYQIIKVKHTNIVVFFELSYFIRIHRIVSDNVVSDPKAGRRFQEMVSLLQYILRQFFKCAEKNRCVFVELLFRKLQENSRDALLDSHGAEFAAILDNYEDERYAEVLGKIEAGEPLEAMRARQRAAQEGNLPWSADEDEVLRDKYPIYADHPLCCELLAAELPEESRRLGRQVRKRLAEIGLWALKKEKKVHLRDEEEDDDYLDDDVFQEQAEGEPDAKKQKTLEQGKEVPEPGPGPAEDEASLAMDLERLLDEAMGGEGDTFLPDQTFQDTQREPAVPGSAGAGDEAPLATQQDTQMSLDLEQDLERMMDFDAPAGTSSSMDLEAALESVLDGADAWLEEEPDSGAAPSQVERRELAALAAECRGAAPRPAPDCEQGMPPASVGACAGSELEGEILDGDVGPSASPPASALDLEMDLERMMDEDSLTQSLT